MHIEIRPATDADVPQFSFPLIDEAYFRTWLGKDSQAIVAVSDGKVIGQVLYSFKGEGAERFAYFFLLHVDEGSRSKGLATRLIAAVEHAAGQDDCFAVALGVADGNPARNLYERLGYTVYGEMDVEIPGGGTERQLAMQKTLCTEAVA